MTRNRAIDIAAWIGLSFICAGTYLIAGLGEALLVVGIFLLVVSVLGAVLKS